MNWTLFLMTQRIEPCFLIYDSKTWALFQKYDLQELNLLKNVIQRIEPFFLNMTYRNFKSWFVLFKYDSQNSKSWTFLQMTRRLELSSRNLSQRIIPFWKMTRRIGFLKNIKNKDTFSFDDSKNWTFFWNITHRTEPFSNMTHGIEPFFPTWLIETEPFFPTWLWQIFDSKNWTFFHDDSKILFNTTQRIELFSYITQRIELFLEICSKNCFVSMTHRIELILKHYLKNGTFESMTQRIERSLIWLKRIELLLK